MPPDPPSYGVLTHALAMNLTIQNLMVTALKLCMLFPAHLQARELCPQTYSLSLPLEWSQVTHIPASIKLGGAYKPEKSAEEGLVF